MVLHYVNFKRRTMSHAHNRPLTTCRVSKEPGKNEFDLVASAKLFYWFFCLNMTNSSQMWLICLLMVRTYFQMFLFCGCFYCIAWSVSGEESEATSKHRLHALRLLEKLTQWLPFAGYSLLSFHILWPCCAALRPEFRSNIR